MKTMSPTATSNPYKHGASLVDLIINDERASQSWFQDINDFSDLQPLSDEQQKDNVSIKGEGVWTHCRTSTADSNTMYSDMGPKLASSSIISTNPSNQTKATAIHKWYTRWFRDWWALEIGSMFLGTVCIVAIAIMLLQVDGREMPRWRLGITIDAILSVLAGLSKSCLLMPTAEALGQLKWPFGKEDKRAIDVERIDRATRGTWGSVVLLARARGVTLASLGAAIILLSLPLDLCFQQIVRYPVERLLDASTNATIARAILYDPLDDYSWRGDDWSISEDQGVSSFLYPSWFADATVGPRLSTTCSTGNCTFEAFDSLGIGFTCQALPDEMLIRGCYNASAKWHSTFASGWEDPRNISTCGYYLNVPGGELELAAGYEVKDDGTVGETLATRFLELSDLFTNQLYYNGSINFGHVGDRIIDFIVISSPNAFEGARANRTPIMQECEVHWTINKLRSEIRDGELHERILSSYTDDRNTGPYWDPTDSNWYTLRPSYTLSDPHSPTGSSTYHVSNITARKIWQAFSQRIPSTFVQPNDERPIKGLDMMKESWLAPDSPHLKRMPDSSVPWTTSKAISSQMAQLVDMVNNVIRNNAMSARGEGDLVIGEVYRNAVMVRVNWEWFAFPATLWCIAVAFLTITIWRTSRIKNAETYKTSLLPMLLNQSEGQENRDLKSSKSMGSIRRLAKVSTVRSDSLSQMTESRHDR